MVADEMISRKSGRFLRILSGEPVVSIMWHACFPIKGYPLFEQTKQEIGVCAALMCLVDHEDGILGEQRIHHGFSKQHAVGQVFDSCARWGRHVFEADGIPNLLTVSNQSVPASQGV